MSEDRLSLCVLFEDSAAAQHFASYWSPKTKDESGLTSRGLPPKANWLSPYCKLNDTYVSAGGVVPLGEFIVEVDRHIRAFARGTRLLAAHVFYDTTGDAEWHCFVGGKRSTAPMLLEAALAVDPAIGLKFATALQSDTAVRAATLRLSATQTGAGAKQLPFSWGEGAEYALAYLDASGDPRVTITRGAEAGTTLLIAYAEYPSLVRRLLDAGLDPNASLKRDNGEHTPLLRAIVKGEKGSTYESVKLLLEAGAAPNGSGSPIAEAARQYGMARGRRASRDDLRDVIELLLTHGADATRRARSGGNTRWWVGGDRQMHAVLDRHGVPPARVGCWNGKDDRSVRLAGALVYDDQAGVQSEMARMRRAPAAEVAESVSQCASELEAITHWGEHGATAGSRRRLQSALRTLAEQRPDAKEALHLRWHEYFPPWVFSLEAAVRSSADE